MTPRSLRGQVAGIGETAYYEHGRSPDPDLKLDVPARDKTA
ncbi:MAG: hypothetical protein RIM84_04980 [Alphaproteobacteria bacterium]